MKIMGRKIFEQSHVLCHKIWTLRNSSWSYSNLRSRRHRRFKSGFIFLKFNSEGISVQGYPVLHSCDIRKVPKFLFHFSLLGNQNVFIKNIGKMFWLIRSIVCSSNCTVRKWIRNTCLWPFLYPGINNNTKNWLNR